jgi:5-formyltetrahydrofolate cyclo-ligase
VVSAFTGAPFHSGADDPLRVPGAPVSRRRRNADSLARTLARSLPSMVGRVAMDAAKRLLRADMREVRRRVAADPVDRAARSARIWARIVSSTDLGADSRRSATQRAQIGRRVMLYEALPGEPDSGPWAEWCRGRGLEVFTPEVDGPELRVMPGDIDPITLDVVVVPGLAFTTDGRRLGQGGGHFDRFLVRLGSDCLTIGVCFHEQLVADLPMAAHDVRVALVVTDTP